MDTGKTKILITGAAGNIGSELTTRLLSVPDNFLVLVDNLSTGNTSKLPSGNDNWKFINADVNVSADIASVMLSYNFDYVFHFAAVVGVVRTQENPIAVLNDIEGIKNILNFSKNSTVKQVYFASSSEVYGEPVELPQHEHRTPLNSRVPYAVVKNVGECFFRSYRQVYGLPYTIFRFFNTYGPNQSTDFVVTRFLAAALKSKDIYIYGDGSQTRTFTFVEDTAEVCELIFRNRLLMNDVINIGDNRLVTISDLARMIIAFTGSSSKIIHLPPLPEGDMTRRQPDNERMRKILGREPLSLEEGLKKMLQSKRFLDSIS
jgi:nucleoside-diphosphate-sugar epimerase